MKKLKDLKIDEIRKLYDDNDQFRIACYDEIQEENSFWWNDRYGEYFEKNGRGYTDEDSYGNIFFRLTDVEEFMKNGIRKTAKDYFSEEAQKHFDNLWNLWDAWTDLTWEEQDENEKIYDEMESEAKYLLDEIAEDLNAIMEITEEGEQNILERILDDECYMSEWETDGEKVYWNETHILK